MSLTLESHRVEDIVVLRCKGRVAHGVEASAFSDQIAELVPLTRQLVVELSEVEMIDSDGLGELVVVLMWAQASGCAMKLASPSPRVRQLLELTNLLPVFETHSSLGDAVQAFGKPLAKKACHAA